MTHVHRKPPIVGLTGGIACGKSTVVQILRELGAQIIDSDQIVRDVQRRGREAWRAIVSHFGEQILTESGEIDRRALGTIVFGDPAQREQLNRIVHPIVIEQIKHEIQHYTSPDQACRGVVVDVPLLYETKMESMFDQVWVVAVSEETQIARLMARDGIDRQSALARIRSQMPIAAKRAMADQVIDNEGDIDHTRAQVKALWEEITR